MVDFKRAEELNDLSIMFDVPVEMLQKKIREDNPKFPEEQEGKWSLKKDLKQTVTGEINCDNVFHKIEIPKKSKNRKTGKRIVWCICDKDYEEFYKKLNYGLAEFAKNETIGYPHHAAYGYVKKKNILENAQCHCGAPLILHLDIIDFFNSITASRIEEMLIRLGIRKNISSDLSRILTIEQTLPLGLHTSPLVSNLICLQLDAEFSNLSTKYNCKYTRYADDITISGKQLPSREEVEDILSKNEFKLSTEKFRRTKPGGKHFVTGLSVETETPRIPKYKKRKLRQELYYIAKHGMKGHLEWASGKKCCCKDIRQNVNRLDGTVTYISYFERKFSFDFESKWFEIRKKEGLYPNYDSKQRGCIYLFFDETEIEHNGAKYLAIGGTSLMDKDAEELEEKLKRLLNRYIISPYESGDKDALRKKGLHYCDASEDLKKGFLEIISKEHLYTYIAYKKLQSSDEYKAVYIELLLNLINDRLLNTSYDVTSITIERNKPKVSEKEVRQIISHRMRYKNELNFVDKGCILLSTVDFALGYFRDYVKAVAEATEIKGGQRKLLFFERIRFKYKVIKNIDDDNKKVFTRRRPFYGSL